MKINNINYEQFAGIRIYDNGKVLYKSDRSYIEVYKLNDEGNFGGYAISNRILSFNLQNEIKRALKLNLNRKDNFYIKEELENSYPKVQYVLYVHSSEIGVENLGEKLRLETEDEKTFINTYKLIFKNGYSLEVLHSREVPENYEFKNNLEKQNYVYVDKGVNAGKHFIREYIVEQYNEAIVMGDYITRHEYSDFRLKAKEIEKDWEKILPYSKLSYYDIEKLLKEYDITKKAK